MNFLTKILLLLFPFLLFTNLLFAQQPNVLFIIVDDIGVGPIPNYEPNTTKANMTHLESMMNEGITFDNVWSNPVCAPSRANILTGKHGFRTNVLNAQSLATLSLDETTLHEYIEQSSNGSYSNSSLRFMSDDPQEENTLGWMFLWDQVFETNYSKDFNVYEKVIYNGINHNAE